MKKVRLELIPAHLTSSLSVRTLKGLTSFGKKMDLWDDCTALRGITDKLSEGQTAQVIKCKQHTGPGGCNVEVKKGNQLTGRGVCFSSGPQGRSLFTPPLTQRSKTRIFGEPTCSYPAAST